MSDGRSWVLFLLNASLPVSLTLLPCLPSCAAVPTTTSSVTSSSFAPPPTASISDRHFWVGVVFSASCHPQRYKNVLFCSHRAMPGTDALFSPMPWESLFPSSHPLEAWVPASRQVGALPLAPRASASGNCEKSKKIPATRVSKILKIFFVDALPFERGGDGDHGNRSVGACFGERNGRSRSEEGDEAVVEEEADREVRSGRGPGVDFFSGGWETHRREPAYLAQGTNEHERNSIRKTRGGKRV